MTLQVGIHYRDRKQAGANGEERAGRSSFSMVLCHAERERRVGGAVGRRVGLCKKDYLECRGRHAPACPPQAPLLCGIWIAGNVYDNESDSDFEFMCVYVYGPVVVCRIERCLGKPLSHKPN